MESENGNAEAKQNLLEVKPQIKIPLICLFCRSTMVTITELLFHGVHTLADCSCEKCSKQFYHTLPVGHDLLFPVSFDKKGSYSSFNQNKAKWLAEPLINSFFKIRGTEAEIEKKVYFEKVDAIILNCLDSCYGHVYTKLWNTQLLLTRHADKGVIVLLPKSMEWLVPKGVAEVWTVAIPLKKLKAGVINLDHFMKKELSRFRNVFLSSAFTHLDTEKITTESFVKRKRFDLSTFNAAPPQITFVLRDDRFWHGNSVELFLYKTCIKYSILKYFRGFFLWRQHQFFNKVARKLSGPLEGVKLIATGIGKKGGLSAIIEDVRREEITEATELEWCNIYAASNIVIGLHGSNMLIPTSLAAGFIDLLPRHKIPNLTQDLVLSYPARYSLFLGRHLDHYATAELVSIHALSMIRDFPLLYKNTEQK